MTLGSIIDTMTQVVSLAVPTILVLLLFYWNVSQIIFTADNPEKRKQALPRLLWSIVALFVIFSLGGIINLISNTLFGSAGTSSSNNPTIQTTGSGNTPVVPRGTTPTPTQTSPTPTPSPSPTPTPRPQTENPRGGFFQI